MSRSHALIYTSIWRNHEFLTLSNVEQHAYLMLLSQSSLSLAGVITLNPRVLASLSAGATPRKVRSHVRVLADRRFVVVDEDTDELWVRTLLRYDRILRSPNLTVAMSRDFGHIRSERIRAGIVNELGQPFKEGLPKGLWERLAEPFKEGFLIHVRGEPPTMTKTLPSSPPTGDGGHAERAETTPGKPGPRGGGTPRANGTNPRAAGTNPRTVGTNPRAATGPETLDAAVAMIARRRLSEAVKAADAGQREPIRNTTGWLATTTDELRRTVADDLAEAQHRAGPDAQPEQIVAAYDTLAAARANDAVAATAARLAELDTIPFATDAADRLATIRNTMRAPAP